MYTPVVVYTCWAKNYKSEASVSSGFKTHDVWDIVEVYCIEDSFVFKKGFDKYFWLFFLIPWVLVLLSPIITTVRIKRKRKMKQELKNMGGYVMARVNFVWQSYSWGKKKLNAMYFTCEYFDRDTNTKHVFKSRDILNKDLRDIIRVWSERIVYVDRMSGMKKYYVDVDDLV